MSTRSDRLSQEDRRVLDSLVTKLNDPGNRDKNRIFAELGTIIDTADSRDPLLHASEVVEYCYDIYQNVWKQAQELRTSGELVALGTHIRCPVVAIHGDYDPHPAEGVKIPLSRVNKKFQIHSSGKLRPPTLAGTICKKQILRDPQRGTRLRGE